jgi:hypothetical protein
VTTFSEFLRQKAENYEVEAAKNKEIVSEWQEAIVKLFTQLRTWLAASDPGKILKIDEEQTDVTEPRLGRYKVPRLEIRALGKWIGIIPKARKTVKTARPPQSSAPERATGRVDITDEVTRYVLYRFLEDGKEKWIIEGPGPGDPRDLTQQVFEDALMSYFR